MPISLTQQTLDPSEGILVYTDGSAYHKDRTGGWSFVALDAFGNTYESCGFVADTTNGAMELTAPCEALEWIRDDYGPCDVLIMSDALYVVLGFMNKDRLRKKNKEVWKRLEIAAERHEYVTFEHVKGHADNDYNERADVLAGKARKERLVPK